MPMEQSQDFLETARHRLGCHIFKAKGDNTRQLTTPKCHNAPKIQVMCEDDTALEPGFLNDRTIIQSLQPLVPEVDCIVTSGTKECANARGQPHIE
jgi:hypothetical protein